MIQGLGQFVPLGTPESGVPRLNRRDVVALLARTATAAPASDETLAAVLQRSFGIALMDALRRSDASAIPAAPRASVASATPLPPLATAFAAPVRVVTVPADAGPSPRAGASPPSLPSGPGEEAPRIRDAAARADVDARFLQALRRAENGGPGREFGVLSVPAPTYDDQARVAAESIRRNVERFEQTGRSAVDPATGRYGEAFIRFFSQRWAPVGAANDPTGLNHHHAGNLSRLYAKFSREG